MIRNKIQSVHTLEELIKATKDGLHSRGVHIGDIAELVYGLQKDYIEDLSMEVCRKSVIAVFNKVEVCHTILIGVALDELAEKNLLKEPLLSIIRNDEDVFGIDEVLPLSIVNVYGSVGFTNFGYLGKKKKGILKDLEEEKSNNEVNTFLDDIVAAIAAAGASRLMNYNG